MFFLCVCGRIDKGLETKKASVCVWVGGWGGRCYPNKYTFFNTYPSFPPPLLEEECTLPEVRSRAFQPTEFINLPPAIPVELTVKMSGGLG